MKDEGETKIFMQMCDEKYRKEGKITRNFNTLTILREENLIIQFMISIIRAKIIW